MDHGHEKEYLPNIEGNPVFDEEMEATQYNVNNRKICFGNHEWINAGLNAWPDNTGSYDIGRGRCGDIRFCKKCKKISCVHHFTFQPYKSNRTKYYHISTLVGVCSICKLRIKLSSYGCHHASEEAWELMRGVVGEQRLLSLPSGFQCELPVQVSEIIDMQGKDAAVRHILHALNYYGVRI